MNYSKLAQLYSSLEETSKRLKKTVLLADFLKNITDEKELERVILLLQGRVFPLWDKRVLGLSEKLIIKIIMTTSGATEKQILDEWRTCGDIGTVAETLLIKKTQNTLFSETLSVEKVFTNLQKVAASEGMKSTDTKVKLIAQLLSSAKGAEAKYIIRSVIGDLRVGVSEGTLRDAIAYAYFFPEESLKYNETKDMLEWNLASDFNQKEIMDIVQSALDRANDFVVVAKTAKTKGLEGLKQISVVPGKPLKVMLAQKVTDFTEGFNKVGLPCAVEYKYDGFRMQVHKTRDGEVKLFTRRLENVTTQFPDVVKQIKEHIKVDECILDSEAVGYDPITKKFKAFQDISQRIRRKYDIELLEEKLPVALCLFDVLYCDGTDYIDAPFQERRAKLETIFTPVSRKIELSSYIKTSDANEAEKFYKESLEAGNEGVMIKKLDAPYQPGSRVGTMIKLKPIMDTFDLAIIGAEWGTGKRSGWLTSFTMACYDDLQGELLSLGKFGTGVKEKEEAKEGHDGAVTFEELTELLKPHITRTSGREVDIQGEIIVEVKFEEIQASPSYESGYALRFPRFVRIRDDRGLDDMTTLSQVETVYGKQRGR